MKPYKYLFQLLVAAIFLVSICDAAEVDNEGGELANAVSNLTVKAAKDSERNGKAVQDLKGVIEKNRSLCESRLANLESTIRQLNNNLHVSSVDRDQLSRSFSCRIDDAEAAVASYRSEIEALKARVKYQDGLTQRQLRDLRIGLFLVSCMAFAAVAIAFYCQTRRIRGVRATPPDCAKKPDAPQPSATPTSGETPTSTQSPVPPPQPENRGDKAAASATGEHQEAEHVGLPRILSACEFLDNLIAEANINADIINKPVRSSRCWQVGYQSVTGNVRERNEDYILCFFVDTVCCCIMGDGCGGENNGMHASYFAVSTVAKYLVEKLGKTIDLSQLGEIARAAIGEAARALAEAEKIYSASGLATTLAVLICHPDAGYHCANLGDGDISVVRGDGSVEKLLKSQKAAADVPNVLAGWVGPECRGDIQYCTAPALEKDVVIACTDGIADIAPSDFPGTVSKIAMEAGANLQAAVDAILKRCTSHKDDKGWVCTDNLSLFVMVRKDA
jgi:serine/threonine protein phosphatase PrpC